MWQLNKILFPVDFSTRSVSAACYVRTLGCRFHPEITLLHVVSPLSGALGPVEAAGDILREAWEQRASDARQRLDDFAARELASFRVRALVSEGEPAQAIVQESNSSQSDLIVMPTRGHGQFRRFILGSVTAKVLHDADCPVWTGAHLPEDPVGSELTPRIQQVVCAIDLFPHSAKVLDWAAGLAKAFNARLFLVHAVADVVPSQEDYYRRDWRDTHARQAQEDLNQMLKSAGAAAEALVVAGEAPSAVCSQAKELCADVLVIGRSSESGLLGRLRTNAYAIIRSAHCPVVSV